MMFDGDSRKHAIKARGAMAMSLNGITKVSASPFYLNADVEHRMSIASKRDTQYSRARGATNTQCVAQLGVCNVILQLHSNLLYMFTRCFSSVSRLTAPCPSPRALDRTDTSKPRDPAYAVVIYSSSRDYGRPLGICRTRRGMRLPFHL